jgi:formylglycine-generating enzyme required for sulfatase activity
VRRKLLILGLVLFLLAGGVIAWTLAGLPPPRYIFSYGLWPGCEPTGETVTLEGVEFVEIGPGIFRMGSTHLAKGGDWLGRICARLGLPWGERPEPSDEMPVHWVEFPRGFWIARTELTNAQYELFDPRHERSEWSQEDDSPVVFVSWEA